MKKTPKWVIERNTIVDIDEYDKSKEKTRIEYII